MKNTPNRIAAGPNPTNCQDEGDPSQYDHFTLTVDVTPDYWLAHAGGAIPMQVVRDPPSDLAHVSFPFWANYLGPVLYFAPFVRVFGAGNAHAFFYGALLRVTSPFTLLLVLSIIAVFGGQAVGIWLWRRRGSRRGGHAYG